MPVFNAFEATNPRLKKNKPFNEGATAGAAKVSSSRGGKSREELRTLGERNGWSDQELLARDVANLGADHYLWFEIFFPARLEHAAQIERNKRQNAERMPIWNSKRMWTGQATEDETERARVAADTFATRTPQFSRTLKDAEIMAQFMKDHELDGTLVQSYTTAFNSLLADEQLSPAPAESADDFLQNHPELHDRRTPPTITARNAKAHATADHFQKAREATAHAGTTSVTDYASDETGYPNYPSKYSFRRLVESLDAESYARRLKDDPQFAAAIDKLNNGNK
jgi:hypothetical protein